MRKRKYLLIPAAVAVAAALLVGCYGKGTRGESAAPQTGMVFVEGGTFTMGCTGEQGDDCMNTEDPSHEVTLNDFYISRYEVTQAQWKAVMGSEDNPIEKVINGAVEGGGLSAEEGASYLRNIVGDSLPMICVNWDDARRFIAALNAKTGNNYRLPTEAEWEYAARGGKSGRGYKYSGGNDVDSVALYKRDDGGNGGNDGDSADCGCKLYPVGTKAPNELGLYDMSGGVMEWTNDWHGVSYYESSPKYNPPGESSGARRVARGGSWRDVVDKCRVSFRGDILPGARGINLGFRVVLPQAMKPDKGGIWLLFENEDTELYGYKDKYGNVMIKPEFDGSDPPCEEFDNIIGVAKKVKGKLKGYYLTKKGKIVGKNRLYSENDCETEGFIRFSDNKTGATGLFNRNGKVSVPAKYDALGKVINGTIIALKDAGEECREDGYCYKTGGTHMLIDTLNNVLIENFPDSYRLPLDFFSMEKADAPHPDTVRVSFPAKGGGYYSFIDIKKEFRRWLSNDLEAALKAEILNEATANEFINWHKTDYWAHAITDGHGKINRREFIVRNYDNLIREARNHSMIHIDETDIYSKYSGNSKEMVFPDIDVIGSDEGRYHSHYEYSRTGNGYRLSHVTVRTAELILNAKIYREGGDFYFEEGSYYEAAVYYEKAIESDPDCAAEYYAMEESGRENGEKAKWEKASGEAAEYFKTLIKPDPAKCAASFYDMGESYIKQGDESKGQAFKNKAEELGYIPK